MTTEHTTTTVLTLLVRDEADIIAATIEHHLAQGISHIIATDNGSIDGTIEILESYASQGVLDLIHEPRQDYDQSSWVTRMARLAATDHAATWVINGDADEFWVPTDRRRSLAGQLSELPDTVDVVSAYRQDLRGRRGVEGPWASTLVWRDRHTQWPDGRPLGPKSLHRGRPDVVVAQGNHQVSAGRPFAHSDEHPFTILHLPLRSWPQFQSKIVNGGSSYAANKNLDASVGWHWREDFERLQAGRLRLDYDSRRLSPTDVIELEYDSRLRHDTWLRETLEALVPTAFAPDLLRKALDGS